MPFESVYRKNFLAWKAAAVRFVLNLRPTFPQRWALLVSLKIEPSVFFFPRCRVSEWQKNATWDWKPQRLSYTSCLHNLRLCGLAARMEALALFCFELVNFCKHNPHEHHILYTRKVNIVPYIVKNKLGWSIRLEIWTSRSPEILNVLIVISSKLECLPDVLQNAMTITKISLRCTKL